MLKKPFYKRGEWENLILTEDENTNPALIMLMGLPASGKSTWADKQTIKVCSSVKMRKELFGSETNNSHNDEVFAKLHEDVEATLKDGKSCIYDATNIYRNRRTEYLKTLPPNVRKYIVVFLAIPCYCMERNNKRDRIVPEGVMTRMIWNIEFPLKNEGWDEIIYFNVDEQL